MLFLPQLVLIGFCIFQESTAKKLPDFVQTCPKGNNECMKDAINKILPHLSGGVPEMGLPPIEPLEVPRMYVGTGSGNFAFNIDATNVKFVGFSKMIVKDVSLNHETLEGHVYYVIPQMNQTCHYKSKGRLLLLDIDSDGELYVNYSNVSVKYYVTGEKYKKNGKTHYKFQSKSVDIKIGSAKVRVDDLFKDPVLNDSINKVLNENFDEAFKAFQEGIEKLLAELLTNYYNSVHERYSVDVLYPE